MEFVFGGDEAAAEGDLFFEVEFFAADLGFVFLDGGHAFADGGVAVAEEDGGEVFEGGHVGVVTRVKRVIGYIVTGVIG